MTSDDDRPRAGRRKVRIGLIGVGAAAERYLTGNARRDATAELVAVADDAEARGRPDGDSVVAWPVRVTIDALLALDDVELVINLAPVADRGRLTRAALERGKHVWSEYPLSPEPSSARALLELARRRGLLLGSGPDVPLGPGLQTARRIVGEGQLGRPWAAVGRCAGIGQGDVKRVMAQELENDQLALYAASLAFLLGPIARAGVGRPGPRRTAIGAPAGRAESTIARLVTSAPHGVFAFRSGAVAALVGGDDQLGTSPFGGPSPDARMIVFGSEGVLAIEDPAEYDSRLWLKPRLGSGWIELPGLCGYREYGLGLGVADMVGALLEGRPMELSADFACHVLEVLTDLNREAEAYRKLAGTRRPASTTAPRPAPSHSHSVEGGQSS